MRTPIFFSVRFILSFKRPEASLFIPARDTWFAGFLLTTYQIHQPTIRPRITFVMWAGYDDNRPTKLYGGHVHGPIFRRFLSAKHVQAVLRALLQEKP